MVKDFSGVVRIDSNKAKIKVKYFAEMFHVVTSNKDNGTLTKQELNNIRINVKSINIEKQEIVFKINYSHDNSGYAGEDTGIGKLKNVYFPKFDQTESSDFYILWVYKYQ